MIKKNSNTIGLTATEKSKFKMLLLTKRNEILGNVISMENEALHGQRSDLSNVPTHMADAGSDNYEIENMLGLMDSEVKLVKEIDEALGRIENGIYGICEGSDKPIPMARLEAIPWAKYCVEYARLLEKSSVKEKDSFIESIFDSHTDEEQNESFDETTEYD